MICFGYIHPSSGAVAPVARDKISFWSVKFINFEIAVVTLF